MQGYDTLHQGDKVTENKTTGKTVFACKFLDGNDEIGFTITNPFGRHGGFNNPQDIMIIQWEGEDGARYVLQHKPGSYYPKTKEL